MISSSEACPYPTSPDLAVPTGTFHQGKTETETPSTQFTETVAWPLYETFPAMKDTKVPGQNVRAPSPHVAPNRSALLWEITLKLGVERGSARSYIPVSSPTPSQLQKTHLRIIKKSSYLQT